MNKFIGTIRELRKTDVSEIDAIYARYWPDQEFKDKLSTRVMEAVDKTASIIEQQFVYFVAEENNEVVGVTGFRKIPNHMREFSITLNPCELYIIAVKHIGIGIGKSLMEKVINTTKDTGYTEIIVYSGETHQKSWGFYDYLGFERVADAIAPNGEPGKIWRLVL